MDVSRFAHWRRITYASEGLPTELPNREKEKRYHTMTQQNTFTVGKYLAARLEQMGLKHYFVVPGDYNLMLLDELLASKSMQQVGCCNELEAAYAAEG